MHAYTPALLAGTAETAHAGRYTGHIFLRTDNGPYAPPGLQGRGPNQWADVT